jgi:hypothetical protein
LLLTTDVQLIQQQALMQLQEKSLLSGTCTLCKRLHWHSNGAIAVIIINNVEDGPVNGGGENMKKLLSRNIIIIRKWRIIIGKNVKW